MMKVVNSLSKESNKSGGSKKAKSISFEDEDSKGPRGHRMELAVQSRRREDAHEEADALARRRENDVRVQTITEEGLGGPPKPNSLQGWLEWFMGDAECDACSGGSCGSSYSDVEPEPMRRSVARFARKTSLVA